MSIVIKRPSREKLPILFDGERKFHREKIVIPGVSVSSSQNFMRGHGTYVRGDDLVASVAGGVEQVNRLISVKPVKSRYTGEIGDVVVGRITDVFQKQWKVAINGRLDALLMLSSVNLPGGELRRKSLEDELMMREYLKEGDLISAEVQKVNSDGQVSLHTRNLRYGKLSQGTLVNVSSHLVKRQKSHFHTLPCGVSIIIGCNGNIWISPIANEEQGLTGGYVQNLEDDVPTETRMLIARVANCVRVLAKHHIPLYDTTIVFAFNCSLGFEMKDLLREEVALKVASDVAEQLREKMQDA